MYEEGMRELEVMRACCGEDEEGFSRAAVSVKLMMLKEDETAEEIDEIVLDNPIVNIYRDPRRTLIDLTFPNVKDFEITNLAVRLQSFMGEKMTMQRDAVPSIMMTLAPKELFGQYFISAIHGMWFLMPSAVGGVIVEEKAVVAMPGCAIGTDGTAGVPAVAIGEDEAVDCGVGVGEMEQGVDAATVEGDAAAAGAAVVAMYAAGGRRDGRERGGEGDRERAASGKHEGYDGRHEAGVEVQQCFA